MELWRAQQGYREATRRLRGLARRRGLGDELLRLELAAACALAMADRVATELSVRRRALNATRARLRRLLKTLRGTRLLARELPTLARGSPEAVAAVVQAWVTERDHPELGTVLGQLRGELGHQESCVRDSLRRLDQLVEHAALAVRRLALAIDALPLR